MARKPSDCFRFFASLLPNRVSASLVPFTFRSSLDPLFRHHGGSEITVSDRPIPYDFVFPFVAGVDCLTSREWHLVPRPDKAGNDAAAPEEPLSDEHTTPSPAKSKLFELSDELILLIISSLETQDVINFGNAVPGLKTTVRSYDFIRMRKLQCFCLKKSFLDTQLGIGVAISGGRRPVFRSEFDLLSEEAFEQHRVRRSIQGVRFDIWLPSPLSRRHWNQVRTMAAGRLKAIHGYAQLANHEPGYIDVLYHFMNTVVVQFSDDFQKGWNSADFRSTLSHTSEKAVEAYFSLYHLLLCLASEDTATVAGANHIVNRSISGPRTKAQFPDLGHVLVAALISDAGLTADLTLLIIK